MCKPLGSTKFGRLLARLVCVTSFLNRDGMARTSVFSSMGRLGKTGLEKRDSGRGENGEGGLAISPCSPRGPPVEMI